MTIASGNETGAQSGTSALAVAADKYIEIYGVLLTCPAGEDAQLNLGSSEVFNVEGGGGNLTFRYPLRGAAGDDVTVDSSGDVSYTFEYRLFNA